MGPVGPAAQWPKRTGAVARAGVQDELRIVPAATAAAAAAAAEAAMGPTA